MNKKSGRATIRDVAALAGVSVAAVSKVLRNAYGVSDTLRSKVQTAMSELGYRPHAAARGMRGQTFTIGVLLTNLRNPFFADVLDGINDALDRTQYQALIGLGQGTVSIEEALIDAIVDRQMDGVIMVGPRMTEDELGIVGKRLPTVTIGHHQPDAQAFDTVNNDDQRGAELVVRHFVDQGYRNITMLTLAVREQGENVVSSQREGGYRAAMEDLGLSRYVNVVPTSETAREVRSTSRKILTSRKRPEAVFCWADYFALEFISVATELGLRIPEDIAVIGYDNTSYCDLAQHALTSIDQSGQLLGLQAARLLIERIKGRTTPEHYLVTPRLVARNSTRRHSAPAKAE